METKYYSIKGTLKRCAFDDFFTKNGSIFENKTFYIKEFPSMNFKDQYKIGSMVDNLSDRYYRNQLNYLWYNNLIFKLSETHNEHDYNFNLYLRSAAEFDLYYGSTNHMIINTTYFCINENNQIIGPLMINENHSGEKFREFLNKGLLLVPNKKQTFEPYKIAAVS